MIKHLQKTFGETDLLCDICMIVEFGERIGIVGANGCGKSTLLHILAKEQSSDGGTLMIEQNCRCGLLKQNQTASELLSFSPEDINPKYRKFLNLTNAQLLHPETLSGGEQTRYALCQILSQQPDLLLLDEPTNHLDFRSTQQLIKLLNYYDGTIITVSHDRYFLDETVFKIIEIEHGVSSEFCGNYTDYREEKARLFEQKTHRYQESKKQQRQIQKAIQQIQQRSQKAHRNSSKADSSGLKMGVKEHKRSQAKKLDKKAKSDQKRLERLIISGEQKPEEEKTIHFEIQHRSNHGKRILQAEHICKSFEQKLLFQNSNFTISHGERVAIFGNNGCGKTTLIEMIQHPELLDSGSIWISPSSSPYILSQNLLQLPPKITTLTYLQQTVRQLTGKDRTLLNNLGLGNKQMQTPVCRLSYGEQMKLKLAIPILMKYDFLILDEPTNHLDLYTREMLETTLSEYQGTLLLISHDIYFLKKICNRVLQFQDHQIIRLEHSFAEYIDYQNILDPSSPKQSNSWE